MTVTEMVQLQTRVRRKLNTLMMICDDAIEFYYKSKDSVNVERYQAIRNTVTVMTELTDYCRVHGATDDVMNRLDEITEAVENLKAENN